jgi:hypothetical protein
MTDTVGYLRTVAEAQARTGSGRWAEAAALCSGGPLANRQPAYRQPAYRQPSAGATWVRMLSMTWAL